jgi:hypothetical protein
MSKIKEIRESDLFGIVVEAGSAATLSSALMEVAGSSKTIYKCEIPYNKEYQESKYGKFKRFYFKSNELKPYSIKNITIIRKQVSNIQKK